MLKCWGFHEDEGGTSDFRQGNGIVGFGFGKISLWKPCGGWTGEKRETTWISVIVVVQARLGRPGQRQRP